MHITCNTIIIYYVTVLLWGQRLAGQYAYMTETPQFNVKYKLLLQKMFIILNTIELHDVAIG